MLGSLGKRGSIPSRLPGTKILLVRGHLASCNFSFLFFFFKNFAHVRKTRNKTRIVNFKGLFTMNSAAMGYLILTCNVGIRATWL